MRLKSRSLVFDECFTFSACRALGLIFYIFLQKRCFPTARPPPSLGVHVGSMCSSLGTRWRPLPAPWVSVVALWPPLAALGCPWPPLAASGRPWLPLAAPGWPWPPLAAPARLWPPLAAPGRPWPPLVAPGRPWPPMAAPGPWSPLAPGRPWPLDQVTLAMRDHISVFAIVSCLGFGLESSHVELDSMIIFIMYFFGFGLRCGLGHFQSE